MKLLCVITVALSITAVVPLFASDADDVERYRNFISANTGRSGVNLADAYERLGNVHFKRGENEAAAKCFSSALSCAEPNRAAEIAFNYASLLMEKKDYKRAEVILKGSLRQSPDSVKLQRALAQSYACQDRIVEALRIAKQCGTETYEDIVFTLSQRNVHLQDVLPNVTRRPLQTNLPITLAAAGTAPKKLPFVSSIPVQVEGEADVKATVKLSNTKLSIRPEIKTATVPVRNRRYIE